MSGSLPKPVRFFKPTGIERVAEVAARPVPGREDVATVQVSRGPRLQQLAPQPPLGPFPVGEIEARLDEVARDLRAEGFLPSGLHALLAGLADPHPARRARTALRLGWRREREAVPTLLDLLGRALDETCSVVDALGAIGDPRAVPAIRPISERKLLSRRRSAVEALRNLGDAEGVAAACERTIEQLPPVIGQALTPQGDDESDIKRAERVAEAVRGLQPNFRGLALDALYETADPAAVRAVQALGRELPFDQPFVWRYVKSVFKRAMLRHDPETFGLLAHLIEAKGRGTAGVEASVKSGYDGVQRQVRIFGRDTQNYLRGLSWRYLRMLARHRPSEYPFAAAEAVSRYMPDDLDVPEGLFGAYPRCYLLVRILFSGGARYVLRHRTWRHRFRNNKQVNPPAGVREEAHPELWDAQPRAYLRILGAARLPDVQVFAYRAVTERHRDTLESAPAEEILPLLEAPYEPTVQLGLGELARRFDPAHPDWALLDRLVRDAREPARVLGRSWLRLTAPLWASDADRILTYLLLDDPGSRLLAAELTNQYLGPDPALGRRLAESVLARLRTPEPTEGAHEALARVAGESLADDINALISVQELAGLVSTGSPAAQGAAGRLLERRSGALDELGLEYVGQMARHLIAAVRSAAVGMLRVARERLRAEPGLLFELVESDWDDTRAATFELLRSSVRWGECPFDWLVGLLDSNRIEVQDFGLEQVRTYLPLLPAEQLIARLVEHPHPNLRPFTLDLILTRLPPGAEALATVRGFCRQAYFDLWPSRAVKRRVLDLLARRGLEDEDQARVAAELLAEVVRGRCRADFERALETLVRIRLAFPKVEAGVQLAAGAAP